MIVIAGDVGGTKSLLAAMELKAGAAPKTLVEERYPSASFKVFSDMILEFMKKVPGKVEYAGLGVAGAVVNGHCRGTNIPWELDESEIRQRAGLSGVRIVNDFAATARGVRKLTAQDQVTLQAGEAEEKGSIGILGAGTGLGEAFLVWGASGFEVISTEAGHADFGARTDEEIELLKFVRAKFGRCSYERILSGPGIGNIYEYVKHRSPERESPAVAAAVAAGDPAAAVSEYDQRGDALCGEALNLFVQIYGAEAGNVALRGVTTGGVYLAGGIAPRMVQRFQTSRFLDAFHDKGRHRVLVEKVPVHLITNTHVGLLGAMAVAEELAEKGGVS